MKIIHGMATRQRGNVGVCMLSATFTGDQAKDLEQSTAMTKSRRFSGSPASLANVDADDQTVGDGKLIRIDLLAPETSRAKSLKLAGTVKLRRRLWLR